jgi:immune inhibitor A
MKCAASIILVAALVTLPGTALPCPAIPTPVQVSQPDGWTFTVEVEGDEYFHFVREQATGYTVIQSRDGVWSYADLGPDGRLAPTRHLVGAADPQATGLSPGLRPTTPAFRQPSLPEGADPRIPPRMAKTGNLGLPSSTKVLALMLRFSDVASHNTQAYWNGMLFGASSSLADYYDEVSYGNFTITGAVQDWRTMPRTHAAYSGDASMWDNLIPDAIAAFDATVDFSSYDDDGDGLVDHLLLICAGDDPSDGTGTGFWPHMSWITQFEPTADGVSVGSYALVDDYTFASDHRANLGTVCHEFGHNLAWPMGFGDLYDPDSGSIGAADNNDYPVRHWCLMGEGNWSGPTTSTQGTVPAHPIGFHRAYAGWVTPTTITSNGTYTLSPIEGNSGTRLYKIPVAAKPQEFFLVEFRKPTAGAAYDRYSQYCAYGVAYPRLDPGLLVTHVDSTMWAKAVQNSPNYGTASYTHYSVQVVDSGFAGYGGGVCPDTVTTRNEARTSAPFSSEDATTSMSAPLSNRFDGSASGVSLSAIGSGAGSTQSFTLARSASSTENWLLHHDDSFPYAAFTSPVGMKRGVKFNGPSSGSGFDIDRAYFCFSSSGTPASFKIHVMNGTGTTDLITPITVPVSSAQCFPMWKEVDLSGQVALDNLAPGYQFMIAIEYTSANIPYVWFDPFVGSGRSYEKPAVGSWSQSTSGGFIDYMIRADVTISDVVPVLLTRFDALPADGGVRLEWEVSDAVDHVGFRVYREHAGEEGWLQLGTGIIEGNGGAYEYMDADVVPGETYRYRLGEIDRGGAETSMGYIEVKVPLTLAPRVALLGGEPNPASGGALIRFTTSWAGAVRLEIFDATGRHVRSLLEERIAGGEHAVPWDGRNDAGGAVGSGTYFVKLTSGRQNESRKITLVH